MNAFQKKKKLPKSKYPFQKYACANFICLYPQLYILFHWKSIKKEINMHVCIYICICVHVYALMIVPILSFKRTAITKKSLYYNLR